MKFVDNCEQISANSSQRKSPLYKLSFDNTALKIHKIKALCHHPDKLSYKVGY